MPLSLPFLATGPRVEVGPHTVHAQTSLLMVIATLGVWRDEVTVDSRAQSVTIRRVRFWAFASTRTVLFGQIAEIAYSMLGGGRGSETFDVALTLHGGEEVPLMRFSGNGEYAPDVSLPFEGLNDRLRERLDFRGDQQEKSLGFVELLSARIGVPLGTSRYF